LTGQGIKTGYWDKTVYHKLYNQIYSHATVAEGSKFEAAMIVRGVASEASSWKKAAQSLAAETATKFAAGKLSF